MKGQFKEIFGERSSPRFGECLGEKPDNMFQESFGDRFSERSGTRIGGRLGKRLGAWKYASRMNQDRLK